MSDQIIMIIKISAYDYEISFDINFSILIKKSLF